MDLGVFFSYQSKVDTVIEYWRNIDPSNANMSDDEILQSFLRYAVEKEFLRILEKK